VAGGVKRSKSIGSTHTATSTSRLLSLDSFQRRLGISFQNPELLDIALTHSSFSNEIHINEPNNERLEFLGDSVLGLCVAHILYERFPNRQEGDLARMKSVLVSEASLGGIAQALGLAEYLLLGKGEEISGGRQKQAILADAMEALLGAYYLDSDFENVKSFIQQLMAPKIEELSVTSGKDYKSIIQEYAQKQGMNLPKYELVKTEGPEHARRFFVTCTLAGEIFGPCEGLTKKAAEQNAAQYTFEKLHSRGGELARMLDVIAAPLPQSTSLH
jgi:ribonuclease-3